MVSSEEVKSQSSLTGILVNRGYFEEKNDSTVSVRNGDFLERKRR